MQTPSHLYEGYIFDLDGTVYLGERFLPHACETITALRGMGKRTVFLSNNPTQSREAYAAKLTRLGLPTPHEDVINSSTVMVDYLLQHFAHKKLFVIGEQPLKDELARAGFELTEKAGEIEIVIASFDRTFDYQKLQTGFDALRAGARFFATNADKYCPVPGGGEPDAAGIIAALEATTDVKVEAVVGKPSPFTAEAILRILDLPPEACLVTGDRLETDVRLGLDAGMDAALTLTGATGREALAGSRIQPTYVLRHLGDLLPG